MLDHDKAVEALLKWGAIAAVGAGVTWWVSRCTTDALKEVREIAVEVRNTVGVVHGILVLPHMAKMIDFAGTVPADQTFTWEQFFAMGRDHRAIVETLRAIVEAHNVTAALAVADKAVPPALPPSEAARRTAPVAPAQPADPELTLKSLYEVKGITDNVQGIINSSNIGKLIDAVTAFGNPSTMSRIAWTWVFALIVLIFACWLAWIYR
eukprot:m.166567 g.166567  ORF g.166567 m.166567 type:complete len:209 (+) comp12707_c0_seq1:260-886(+)